MHKRYIKIVFIAYACNVPPIAHIERAENDQFQVRAGNLNPLLLRMRTSSKPLDFM